MLKAILFDIDNTLLSFDGYVKKAMHDGFQKYGLRAYAPWMFDVFTKHNIRLWSAVERGELTLADLEKVRWNDIFHELQIEFDGEVFEDYFKAELCESAMVIDGARELLEALSGRYKLCVASNGPLDQQVRRLTIAGLREYFEALFVSEEIGCNKPAPAFFETCLRRLGNAPNEVLMVGDSLSSDILGGIRAGLQTCFYNPHGKPVPASLSVNYTVRSLRELADLL